MAKTAKKLFTIGTFIKNTKPYDMQSPPLSNNLHYSIHTGKLQGMVSLSTSCQVNEFCRAQTTEICQYCFAFRTTRMYHILENHLRNNFKLLQKKLDDSQLIIPPSIKGIIEENGGFLRLHSFGELASKEHAYNFVKMAILNPTIQFTLWTKRPWLIQSMLNTEWDAKQSLISIPPNFHVIYSIGKLNISSDEAHDILMNHQAVYPFIKSAYYGGDAEHGFTPCGTSCQSCKRCYPPTEGDTIAQLLHC